MKPELLKLKGEMLNMILKNKYYDILVWVVQIVLPASVGLIGTIGGALNWQYTEITMTIIGAVTTFFGVILGVSNKQYKKEEI